MIIEHTYKIPSNFDYEYLMTIVKWAENNLGNIELHQKAAQLHPIFGLNGAVAHSLGSAPPIELKLHFENENDLNYFRLIFGKDLDDFLYSQIIND